jgi:hypothetical protein
MPLPDNTQHSQETSMLPTGFEQPVPANDRSQAHALDRAATGGCFQHGTVDKVHIATHCKSVNCCCVTTAMLLFIRVYWLHKRDRFSKSCHVPTTAVTRRVQLSSSFLVKHSNKKIKWNLHSTTKATFMLSTNVVKDEPDFTKCVSNSSGLERTRVNWIKLVSWSFHVYC